MVNFKEIYLKFNKLTTLQRKNTTHRESCFVAGRVSNVKEDDDKYHVSIMLKGKDYGGLGIEMVHTYFPKDFQFDFVGLNKDDLIYVEGLFVMHQDFWHIEDCISIKKI